MEKNKEIFSKEQLDRTFKIADDTFNFKQSKKKEFSEAFGEKPSGGLHPDLQEDQEKFDANVTWKQYYNQILDAMNDRLLEIAHTLSAEDLRVLMDYMSRASDGSSNYNIDEQGIADKSWDVLQSILQANESEAEDEIAEINKF